MQDKLWREKLYKDKLYTPKSIQLLIDFYCFDSNQFKIVEDITPENLGEFWKIMLKEYKRYNIHLWDLENLCEGLWDYFNYAYPEELS